MVNTFIKYSESDSVLIGDFVGGITISSISGNVTITGNLTVNGTSTLVTDVTIGTNLLPDANDGATIGSATLSFSDLFLASGAVINFANGDVTITHSTNLLAFAGASTGYTFDQTLLIGAAGGSTGQIQLAGATSGIVSINPAAVAGTWTLTLPTDDGTASQVLQTDGAGVTSWATVTTVLGANPTASVGLSAVNGVATTYLRSDGAPALDVSIAPTWTGAHIWSGSGLRATFTNTQDVASSQVAIFQGDRATPADNDLAYLSLQLSDSAGTQREGARITWQATTVLTGATGDTDLIFSALVNNAVTTMLTLDGSANELVPAVPINSATNITGVTITATSLVIGANTITTSEWAFLDGLNQPVATTSSPTFVNLTITSFAANWTNAGRTVADLGIITSADINGGTIDGVSIGASVVGSGSFNSLSSSSAVVTPITITNTIDSASVQAGIFQGDRATMADNDEAYLSFKLSNDAGTQTEFARLTWVGADINAGTMEDGRLDFGLVTTGVFADELALTGASLYPSSNDGLQLGIAVTNEWSDIFLAEGGVINWDNGDMTITQAGNTMTIAGGNLSIAGLTVTGGSIDTTISTALVSTDTAGSSSTANAFGLTIVSQSRLALDRTTATGSIYAGLVVHNENAAAAPTAGSEIWGAFIDGECDPASGTGTFTAVGGLKVRASVSTAFGTATDAYGLYVDGADSTGVITNLYGVYIENVDGGGTLNYSIYTGTGIARFGDEVQLDKSATGEALDVNQTGTTYLSAETIASLTRTGNLTASTGNTTLNDLTIIPSFIITEAASDTFTYSGARIDMSAVTVTAGAGDSELINLNLVVNTDTDATSRLAIRANGEVELNPASTSVVAAIDINWSAAGFTTAVGIIDIVRSGAITGAGADTIVDLNILPSFTLTEPGGALVTTYNLMAVSAASILVTAGAGDVDINVLRLIAGQDTDARTNRALFVSGESEFEPLVSTIPILDINASLAGYTTNVAAVDINRSGVFTGVSGETMVDFKISNSAIITEPASGIFTYNMAEIDMSGLSVTAAGGATTVTGLKVSAVTDTDAATRRALYTEGGNLMNNSDTGALSIIDANWSAAGYQNAVGVIDIVRSGAITITDTQSAIDFQILPIFTLTEPGAAATGTYYGANIDVSGITVTGGAGDSTIVGLHLVGSTAGTTNYTIHIDSGISRFDGRVLEAQGADVASANDLTLGLDGNVFEITGTTQVNAITTANWTTGSLITLIFTSTPTVKHNTAGGAGTAVILLASALDFAATGGDTLTLRYSEQGGTNAWREVSRAVI